MLTARHCRIDKTTRVVFADGSSYKITRYFVPRVRVTNDDDEHDLALIKIDGEVAGPVAEIASEAMIPPNGSYAWTVGYGGKRLTKRSNRLRRLAVRILDRDYSSSAITVRAEANGAVCDGDSGGPGYIEIDNKVVLWGIDSASMHGDAKCSSRELYAKVSSEYDWIRKTIAAGPGAWPVQQRGAVSGH